MRIIAGEFRSRRLLTPRDASTTRPIPDRVKESLFGLLRGHVEGANIFDAFAGTGAIGLEALSRGAARCTFVERDRKIAAILRQNIENLGVEDRCDLVVGDALGPGALARCPRPVTLAFLDPPYQLVRGEVGWKRVRAQLERLVELLTDDGFAIVRTPWPFMLKPEAPPAEPPERKGKRRGRPDRRRRQPDQPDAPPIDVDDAVQESEAEAVDTPEGPALIAPEMDLPNAAGPELRTYHTTALHWYARRKDPE